MQRQVRKAARLFKMLRQFVSYDVWHIHEPSDRRLSLLVKQTRVILLLARSVVSGQLLLRASALTFTTILALVPLLAITFMIIQGFNLGEELYERLKDFVDEPRATLHDFTQAPFTAAPPDESTDSADPFPGLFGRPVDRNEELKKRLIAWIFRGVAQEETGPGGLPQRNPIDTVVNLAQQGANLKSVRIIGVLIIITTVFGLMRNIESAFNDIWGVKRRRPWYRRFSDYLIVLLLMPFVAAAVLGITVALQSPSIDDMLGPFAIGLRSIQYVVIWLAFTALYLIVPSTNVKFRYALFAGIVAGTLWVLNSFLYVKFQIGLTSKSIVYSGFAQFPMFLMWVYAGWIIVLLGAQISFAYQNEKTFVMERLASGASFAYREALAIRTMVEVAFRFDTGQAPFDPVAAAEEWTAPTRLINENLETLEDADLVRRCGAAAAHYVPARSIDRITLSEVVHAMRTFGQDPSALLGEASLRPLLAMVSATHNGGSRPTMRDIVDDLRTQQSIALQDESPELLSSGSDEEDAGESESDEEPEMESS